MLLNSSELQLLLGTSHGRRGPCDAKKVCSMIGNHRAMQGWRWILLDLNVFDSMKYELIEARFEMNPRLMD